ncbi:hypothetical protein RRG08_045124 [Elysia crispata]|uniref:Uncharacterized protein n=1 Tax=Elysia crispata TaxID=231223 RepID=A0AAE0YUR3_9GAST|nr:hypothetical protein RRG08_045124 [Elysia crispata]
MYSDRAIFGDNEKTSERRVTPSTPVGVSLVQTQSGAMLTHANILAIFRDLSIRLEKLFTVSSASGYSFSSSLF